MLLDSQRLEFTLRENAVESPDASPRYALGLRIRHHRNKPGAMYAVIYTTSKVGRNNNGPERYRKRDDAKTTT